MSCPVPADMQTCDPKCRCGSGPCAGTAFSCDDPCQGSGKFNPATCECETEVGIYRITSVANGTSELDPSVTTFVYYANIPEPFIGTGGALFRYAFVQNRVDVNYSQSAFVNGSVSPDTLGELSICGQAGTGSRSLSIVNRTLTLSSSYCESGATPPDGAGTGAGSLYVAAYNMDSGCVEPSSLAIQPTVLWGGCATHRTAYANYTIEYLGEGEFGDYVDTNCLSGLSNILKVYTC